MTAKQAIGEYSAKFVTMSFSPGPAGGVIVQANFEGTATGFGIVCGTMTASPAGQPSGTFETCVVSYPDDGNSLTRLGRGTFSRSGANRWRTQGPLQLSDGRTLYGEEELDLASRVWSGKMFAAG
jgi:hypothetical protein